MSHFVLRRIGRFNERHGRIPAALVKALESAPLRVFSDERLAEMKQLSAASGDLQRLQTLESYERQLAQVSISRLSV